MCRRGTEPRLVPVEAALSAAAAVSGSVASKVGGFSKSRRRTGSPEMVTSFIGSMRKGVEIIAIERTFPELALPQRRRVLRRSLEQATKRTRRMSAAGRKAVSARMKRYWAERRKARAKVK